MPLNLTKINCITLKIRSKTEFMCKSQNIWQHMILLCTTVMQMICAWPKIWTLSERLSLMRNVQLMKKKYISCVPHKNNWGKNWFTRHETDRFLNNHCQECVRAYLSIHDCVTGVFDLCLNYLPFWNLAFKSRHLFWCWYVVLIYFVMIRLFVICWSYLNIDTLLEIKFV